MSKVLFFNKDQSYKTRALICQIMGKLVLDKQFDEELWRAIWEYFHDKEPEVREYAHKLICTIHHTSNFQKYIETFSEELVETEACKFFPLLFQVYGSEFKSHQRAQNEIISFINRIFRSKSTENTIALLKGLTQKIVLQTLSEQLLFEQVNFSMLSLRTGTKQLMEATTNFYHSIENIDFKENIKTLVIRNLKQMHYEFYGDYKQIAAMLDFEQEEEVSLYLAMCSKMLESSKWNQLKTLLEVFRNIVFTQHMYDKACTLMLKLWMSCPSMLLEIVVYQIIYLVLINKRSFQFLITIRQKLLNSKCWNQRKNYIKFYSAIRSQTSFDCHKFMPILIYKNIIADKCYGVRLTFLANAVNIYKHTDPETATEKGLIKEAVSKLEEDKDLHVRRMAAIAKEEIGKLDQNPNHLAKLYDRNRELVEKQAKLTQVIHDRKIIKTENQIPNFRARSKRSIGKDHRKTINGGKLSIMHKQMSIDSISTLQSHHNLLIANTSNLPPKKNNLFRCYSVKMKGPSSKKI